MTDEAIQTRIATVEDARELARLNVIFNEMNDMAGFKNDGIEMVKRF